MKLRELTVSNKFGLHARPATSIVKLLDQYECEVFFITSNLRINANSILEILTLAACYGTVLTVEMLGRDCEEVFLALEKLFQENFGEEQ